MAAKDRSVVVWYDGRGWEGDFMEPDSSASTAGQVGRSSLPIVIMPAVHFMKPICDLSTLHTQNTENNP